MKAFAFVLLCALAAVQGRHTALQSTRSAAALGENPWLVHLRIAVSTSGLLNTGAGTLIASNWVLTTADNVVDTRFVWLRYGAVNVLNPSFVTEVNALAFFIPNPNYNAATGENNIGLININRNIQTTANIAPISSVIGEVSDTIASLCIFGETNGVPGEVLNCYNVDVVQKENGNPAVLSDEVQASAFDNGAPLIDAGVQIGLLVGPGSEGVAGEFIATADYQEWIEEVTGLDLNSKAVAEAAPEAVRFIQ